MSQNPGMNAPYGQQPAYAAPGTVPATASGGSLVPGGALAVLGGIAAIIGVFLTWATIALSVAAGEQSQNVNLTVNGLGKIGGAPAGADLSTNGTSDGYFVIVAGVLALVGGLLALTKKRAGAIVALIGGIAALGLGIYEMTQVSGVEDQMKEALGAAAASGVDFTVAASTGIGIWIIIVGGALALIGSILAMAGGRKTV